MMKKLMFLLLMANCSILSSQRLPTDAVVFPVQSTNTIYGAFIDVENLDKNHFWSVASKSIVERYSAYSLGEVAVEKRRTSDLEVADSLIIVGKAHVQNIESDDSGNLFISGIFTDSISIGPNNSYYAPSVFQSFVLKLDTQLQLQWMNTTTDAHHITVSPNGRFIFARGDWNGFGGNMNIYKFDTLGNVIQTKQLNNIGYMSSIKVNNKGELFFSGGCISNNTQLDTIMVSHSFSYSMYYGKLDSNMNAAWIRILDDISCVDIFIEIDTLSNSLFYSTLNKTVNLDTFQATPNLSNDFLLASLNSSGNPNFLNSAPANYRIASVYGRGLAGMGNKVAVLLEQDPGTNIHWGNNLYTNSGSNREQLIVEYNINTGHVTNASMFQTLDTERLRTILYLSNGDILTTGVMYYSELHTSTDTLLGSNKHFYIERWELPKITSIEEYSAPKQVVYPNPSGGVFNLNGSISGTVYDLTGKEVSRFHNAHQIDLSNSEAGIYILKTEKGIRHKLIKY